MLMLLEDKWLKKVNSSAVEQVEGRTFAKCNQKTYSNNHELFQKFQSYCPWLWIQKTLELHFEKSDTTFFLSLSRFEGVLRSCSQLYNMLL